MNLKPDQIRASKFMGSTVYDLQNQNIGSVKDLIFDRDGPSRRQLSMSALSSAWAANTSRSS